jgi:hypothetical protein
LLQDLLLLQLLAPLTAPALLLLHLAPDQQAPVLLLLAVCLLLPPDLAAASAGWLQAVLLQ